MVDWEVLDNIRKIKMVLSLTLNDNELPDNENDKFMSIHMINLTFTQTMEFFDFLKELEEKLSVTT